MIFRSIDVVYIMQNVFQDNTVIIHTRYRPQKIGLLHIANLSMFKNGQTSTTTDYITGTVPAGGVWSLIGTVVTVELDDVVFAFITGAFVIMLV